MVWHDENNNGFVDEDELGIAGIVTKLYQADNNGLPRAEATPIGLTITNGAGYYLFTGLSAGAYRVEVEPPIGYISSTGAGYSNLSYGQFEAAPAPDDDPTDNDDNGTASSNVVWSGLVTLTSAGEPRGELAMPGLPDNTPDGNANYTVDFGFFELPTALDGEKPPQTGHFIFLPLLFRH